MSYLPDLQIDLSKYERNATVNVISSTLSTELQSEELSGKRLAPVRQFARKLGVARQTMQKVYERLEKEGTISRMPGKRIWNICANSDKQLRSLGIILPMLFSEYFLPGTEYGQRRLRVYSGIIDQAMKRGFVTSPLLLPPVNTPADELEAFIAGLKRQYCALIHLGDRGFAPDPILREILRQDDLPQISFQCEFPYPNIGAVTFDPDYVARMAISYFREFGHRNICIVYHDRSATGSETRYVMAGSDDLKHKFANTGAPADQLSFMGVHPVRTTESMQKQLDKILKQEIPPTAFWCRNDELAFCLIRQLQDRNYRVPHDFSVIGFNNAPETETFDPPLSTFFNPDFEMGEMMVSRLDEYLNKGITEANRVIRVPALLVSRRSVSVLRQSIFQ